MKLKTIAVWLSGFLIFGLTWLLGPQYLTAQAEGELWQLPINLSQSGTATTPFMVIDKNGAAHLFWRDAIDGFMYAAQANGILAEAQPVRLPFSEPPFTSPGAQNFAASYTPHLVADDGFISAIWADGEQTLYFSRSAIPNLSSAEAWSAPVVLDTFVAGPRLVVDGAGNLHAAYVKQRGSAERPAGVYYQRFDNQSGSWSGPQQRYASNYLRAITPDQAHVGLAASADGGQVYLVWDNPLLGIAFFARSISGGNSWDEPIVVDEKRPDDEPESSGAARIEVLAIDQEVHLTWQAQHGRSGCQQYHQRSVNRGQTWREPVGVGTAVTPAELRHAIHHEMAERLNDLVLRRSERGSARPPAPAILEKAADLMAQI